jgi:hypothetical protein
MDFISTNWYGLAGNSFHSKPRDFSARYNIDKIDHPNLGHLVATKARFS